MSDLVIEFDQVTFARGETSILKAMSCQVTQGERLAILGSSGSGKTTFLRLCAGLERPQSGRILLRGQEVASDKIFVSPARRQVGFVFQNSALFEKITVKKNIYYGCKCREHYSEADRLMARMDLARHINKWPSQLSGGERQKVALARSLALKPDIILLDEPLASLDSTQSFQLIDDMKALFSQLGITAVMVTHTETEAKAFASRTLEFDPK